MVFFVPISLLMVRVWLPSIFDVSRVIGVSIPKPSLITIPFKRALLSLIILAILGFALGVHTFGAASWFRNSGFSYSTFYYDG